MKTKGVVGETGPTMAPVVLDLFLPTQLRFVKYLPLQKIFDEKSQFSVFKLVRVRRRVEQAAALPPSYSLVTRYILTFQFGHKVYFDISIWSPGLF